MAHGFCRMLSAGIALALSQFSSTPAEARREWPGHGAGGGKLFWAQCPDDKAMVGVTGATGRYIDRIQIVCATLYDDGTFGPPEPYGDPVGAAGGNPREVIACNSNEKIFDISINIDYVDEAFLDGFTINCQGRDGRFRPIGGISSRSFNRAGVDLDRKPGVQSCPQEHFIGLKIYFKEYVKAVGAVCDSVEVTPKQAAAAPPPPKVIRSTGRARQAGPPVAPRLAMAGVWDTLTSSNANFRIILTVDDKVPDPLNGQLSVSGQFINQQGSDEFGGSLQGFMRPSSRTLEYTYVQKNGARGSGVFTLSDDGKAIAGSGKTSDGQEYTWNGTRAGAR